MIAFIGKLFTGLIGDSLIRKIIDAPPPPLNESQGPTKGLVQSKTFWGVIIMVAPTVATWLGWSLSEAETQGIITAGTEAFGALLALWGRIKAVKPIG